MLLNFSDRTRTGVFNMIWPLARAQENVNRLLFQQHKYILTYMRYLERFQQIRLRFAIWAFIQIYFLKACDIVQGLKPAKCLFYLWSTPSQHQPILWNSFLPSIFCSPWCTCFGSTYTKIGTIQRRLAWPLRKDDTQNREAFHIFWPRDVILVC